MNILENIRLAWEGVRANKMRALLTMLGIIIGIGSVIAILTVGDSMSSTVTNSMSSLGATNITLSLQEKDDDRGGGNPMSAFMGGGAAPDAEHLMTDEMLAALKERYPEAISGVSLSESAGSGQAKEDRLYANVGVSGVNTEYLRVNSVTLLKGRDLQRRDEDGGRNVAIVSDKLVNNLYRGDANAALGKELTVQIDGEISTFRIIGVYAYEQTAMNFSMAAEKDISTTLYIPLSTAKKMVNADEGYARITLSASDAVDSASFAKQAQDFLNRYYVKNKDYRVSAMSMESMLDQMNSMMSTMNIALSVIAGISLLVGGIGVMNIMLVSVTERTREIGTRKAIGATNGNIRMQFVVESTIICLIGGMIGVAFGGGLGYLGSSLLGVPAAPSVSAIALAVGFSMGIGIFFGYYPANKAAKLDPIEALRYE